MEGHRNELATISDLALTALRFETRLVRNIAIELCHVLIMLTRGRAHRLVLKVSEPEGLEAYRLLLRRYGPISTVMTVSKLVELLATTFSGDLTDGHILSDEYHPGSMTRKKNTVRPDQNWSCHQRSGKRWIARSLVEQHCWHDRMDEICERNRKRQTGTKKHTACADGFVGDGQSRSKVPRELFMVWNLWTRGERLSKDKPNTCKTTKQVDGLVRTTKAKAKASASKTHCKGESKPGKGKGKNKNKGKGEHHGKKGKKGFHEMEGHDDTQDAQTSQDYTAWTGTSWDHADNCDDASWWTIDLSTDLLADLGSNKRHEEQSNPTHRGSISMLGGLSMCEVSVGDERQQNGPVRGLSHDWTTEDTSSFWVAGHRPVRPNERSLEPLTERDGDETMMDNHGDDNADETSAVKTKLQPMKPSDQEIAAHEACGHYPYRE